MSKQPRFKNHDEALDYLIKHLWEIDEQPYALDKIIREPEHFGRNPRRAVPMCDLVLLYQEGAKQQATLVELKSCRKGKRHGVNQLYSGRTYLERNHGITWPELKLAYYSGKEIQYEVIR